MRLDGADDAGMVDVGDDMLLCPACGYDLRGSPGDRCSECGLVLDRATLDHSNVPWAYRRTIGRVKAFLKTVWLVTLDAGALRHEDARRQSPRDAASFSCSVTVAVVGCALAVVGLISAENGFRAMALSDDDAPSVMGRTAVAGAELDMRLPWSAGLMLPGAPYAYAALCAVVLVAASGSVFRTREMDGRRANAARAMGRYAVAPLVWLVPAVATFLVNDALASREEGGRAYRNSAAFVMLFGLSWLFAAVAVVATVHRTGQWRARLTHGGYGTGFLAMGELVLRWGVGAGVALFAVP